MKGCLFSLSYLVIWAVSLITTDAQTVPTATLTSTSTQPKNMDVRLTGGTVPWEGLLEVYHTSEGWYGVCEDFLGYEIRNAHVVCRQLGYGYALEKPNPNDFDVVTFYSRRGIFKLDCSGLEENIRSCEKPPNLAIDCYDNDLFAVRCSNVENNDPVGADVRLTGGDPYLGTGRVEVLYQNLWYRVCNDGWYRDNKVAASTVVCRQLGFDYALDERYDIYYDYNLSEYAVITDVRCNGNEQRLSECENTSPGMHSCGDRQDATVRCRYDASPTLDPGASLRLINGSDNTEGLVQIYHDYKWWTICDKLWDLADAMIICRQLGFKSATSAFDIRERQSRFLQFEDDVGILIGWLDCKGMENSLAECRHSPLGQHQCGHYRDAAVDCSDGTFDGLPTPAFSLRLAGGSNNLEGAVEVYHRDEWGGFQWSRICSIGWEMVDAEVVCRQLNFTYALTALKTSSFGKAKSGIHQSFSEIGCEGDEPNLGLCKMKSYRLSSCTTKQDAAVICSDRIPYDNDVRLVGGPNIYTGEVQVYAEGYWRQICTCNTGCWSMQEATTVCRSLGYKGASSTTGELVADGNYSFVIPFHTLNCEDTNDLEDGASYLIQSCAKEMVYAEWCHADQLAKTVTCIPETEEFEGRLEFINGEEHSYEHSEGYVRIKYGPEYYFVCAESWDAVDAGIFCRSLGYKNSSGSANVGSLSGWDDGDLLAIMSQINCTLADEKLHECEYRFGLQPCPDNQFAATKCEEYADAVYDHGPGRVVIFGIIAGLVVVIIILIIIVLLIRNLLRKSTEQQSASAYTTVAQGEPEGGGGEGDAPPPYKLAVVPDSPPPPYNPDAPPDEQTVGTAV